MQKRFFIFALLAGLFAFSSCSTVKNIPYFQDIVNEGGTYSEYALPQYDGIRFKPEDRLSIVVNSKDPQLAALFNLPIYSHQIGVSHLGDHTYASQQIADFSIDQNGDIFYPVIGNIHAAGYTRTGLAEYIRTQLVERDLVKDPVVTVEFRNLKISILGEVARPGCIDIDHDRFTIYDALGSAGDMTIYGMRNCVKVLRNEEGVQKTYVLDLMDSESVLTSPAYYLQQNDVVYVSPNKMRQRQSTVNGNNILSASFWVSIASLTATILNMILK